MGPSAFTDGDHKQVAATKLIDLQLQWGRRRSPTETVKAKYTGEPIKFELQWGRRRSPTETVATPSGGWAQVTLQWGRRRAPTETAPRARTAPAALRCFNGAVGVHRRRPVAAGSGA